MRIPTLCDKRFLFETAVVKNDTRAFKKGSHVNVKVHSIDIHAPDQFIFRCQSGIVVELIPESDLERFVL